MSLYKFEKNEDGSYKVISILTYPRVEIESLIAEELTELPGGALLARQQEQYTLYALSLDDLSGSHRWYGALHKFLDGILEYFSFGDVFLYRTVKGWFFLFYHSAFWKIGNKNVLKKRVESLTKLCEPDTQILECKVLNNSPCDFGYMVKTSKESFLLYKGNGSVYGVIPTYFIRMNRYSKVPGYVDLAKIYPNKGKKFFLAHLSCIHIFKPYNDELLQKITYLGEGYWLAQNGAKSKLLFCYNGALPYTVVDWGIQSFTKVDSVRIKDYTIQTTWRVDSDESSYIVYSKYYDNGNLSIPELKEKKKG